MSVILMNDSTMTEIADAIREKSGTTEQMIPSEMAKKINDVYEVGKSDGLETTNDANAIPNNILQNKSAYVKGKKIIGAAQLCGTEAVASGGNMDYCKPSGISVSDTNELKLTVRYYKSGWNTTTFTITIK